MPVVREQRLWVELEVFVSPTTSRPYRYVYQIFNPRTKKPLEMSPFAYRTHKETLDAGVAYLRATYNTGQPQKKR